jgi:hypothetical protein
MLCGCQAVVTSVAVELTIAKSEVVIAESDEQGRRQRSVNKHIHSPSMHSQIRAGYSPQQHSSPYSKLRPYSNPTQDCHKSFSVLVAGQVVDADVGGDFVGGIGVGGDLVG